ncbi:hypothetical protein [Streptomyces sp. NBC_01320]|uniref:hypothetical protein n=1 Tax=Streptomyces sp. NBC_01320 TaxID=2903824 RepID=UPI002E11FCE8
MPFDDAGVPRQGETGDDRVAVLIDACRESVEAGQVVLADGVGPLWEPFAPALWRRCPTRSPGCRRTPPACRRRWARCPSGSGLWQQRWTPVYTPGVIAVATGQDLPLEQELAEGLWAAADQLVDRLLDSFGVFAPALQQARGGDRANTLPAFVGRDPHWRPAA